MTAKANGRLLFRDSFQGDNNKRKSTLESIEHNRVFWAKGPVSSILIVQSGQTHLRGAVSYEDVMILSLYVNTERIPSELSNYGGGVDTKMGRCQICQRVFNLTR